MHKLVSSLILGAFLLAACSSGGGGTDAETQKYVDAMMESFDSSEVPFNRSEARCLAESMVDTIGVDTLEEADITPESLADGEGDLTAVDLNNEEANELADAVFDGECFDVSELIIESMNVGDADISEKKLECFVDGLVETEVFRDAMVDSILGKDSSDAFDAAGSELFSILGDCDINPSDLG